MTTRPSSPEQRVEQLLGVDRFPPPPEFVANAAVTDKSVYADAADAPAWWAGQARRRLDWHRPFTVGLDDSEAPFFRWFTDGTLNASYNCLDRHVEAGRGDKVAFHWRGEEDEERDVTWTSRLSSMDRKLVHNPK